MLMLGVEEAYETVMCLGVHCVVEENSLYLNSASQSSFQVVLVVKNLLASARDPWDGRF